MPEIVCGCGKVIDIGALDEGFAYSLISQNAIWEIMDTWSDKKEFTPNRFVESFKKRSVEVYECPFCKGLLFEELPDSNKFNFYKKEA